MELLVLAGVAVAIAVAVIAFSSIQQREAHKEFGDDDPVQRRLGDVVETYLYSAQDAAAYDAFAEDVRREFETFGVASPERLRFRLMHAAELNRVRVKSGLRKKPTPSQTMGAARAIAQLLEEK